MKKKKFAPTYLFNQNNIYILQVATQGHLRCI